MANHHLVVKSTFGAGLGDRVRSVISALLYARESERNLYVFWDDGLYGSEGENVFPLLFDLSGVAKEPLDLGHHYTCRPAFWTGELHQPMKVLYGRHGPKQWDRRRVIEQFSFDQSRLDHPEEVLVMWEFDQFGAWLDPRPRWDDHEFINTLVRRHLAPAAQVADVVEVFRRAHFYPRMIGVHVRRTHEPAAQGKQVREKDYHRLIRRIKRWDPEVRIFLATDNSAVQRRFSERYGDALVTTPKWFAAPGEPLHIAEGRDDRLDMAREALMDLFLLAACDYLIYPASSSFSMVARWFSTAPIAQIYPLSSSGGLQGALRRVWAFPRAAFL